MAHPSCLLTPVLILSLSQCIKVLIAFGIFLSYPLNGFVAITVIFSDFDKNSDSEKRHSAMLEYVVRIFFLLLTGEPKNTFPNAHILVLE